MQAKKIVKAIRELKLNINDFQEQSDFVKNILNQLVPINIIGEGAVGKIYLIDDGKYVVKSISPCLAPENSPLRKYCNDLLNLKINPNLMLIPGGNSENKVKNRYIIPNLLSEIAIGSIFNEFDKECLSFTKILGSFILTDEKSNISIYILMEAHTPIVTTIFNNRTLDPRLNLTQNQPLSYLYLLFQISHALCSAQEKYMFTHYDLHIENILYTKNIYDYISYPLPNNDKVSRIMIPNNLCPFIIKITDYGLSRSEIDKVIVTPTIDTYPENTFGEFSPSYDIISFLGTTIFDIKTSPLFSDVFSNKILARIVVDFMIWIFNEDISITEFTLPIFLNIRDYFGKKYFSRYANSNFNFRPKKFEASFVAHNNIKSMVQIVNYLADLLMKYNAVVPHDKNKNVLILSRISNKYREYDSIIAYTSSPFVLDVPMLQKETEFDYSEMNIDKNINVKSYRLFYNSPPNNFNFTIDKKQIENCPLQEHFITVVFVSNDIKDYKFSLDCCKIDAANYLRDSNKTGFVINGGFFNISKDYLPIGEYRDKNNEINNYPIPEKYRDVYRYIVIENNKIKIVKDFPKDKRYQAFASGPILIENGQNVFKPYEERFACVEEKILTYPIEIINQTEKDITISGYYEYQNACSKTYIPKQLRLPKCDKISPGELSHADNPNPRSALAILKDGSYIFITVEGRGNRGVGMDLLTLSDSLLKTFPNIETAINLDGGRSSNIAWRTINDNRIFISNPDHMYTYPNGNILSLTK